MASLATAALCATLLTACRAQQPQENVADDQPMEKPSPQRLSIVEPPFDRARLLLSVVRAASAHSTGMNDTRVQRSLDGKQFEVRIRFGCDGPGPGNGGYGWSLDPDGRTLRLRATPTLSLDDDVVGGVAGEQVEVVEGFWLARPWLLQPDCPSGRSATASVASGGDSIKPSGDPAKGSSSSPPGQQRIGIAQFFTAEDARTRRRMDRPFEAVKQLGEGDRTGQHGFDLVLEGRLRAQTDGRVILCTGSGLDRPPDCIVSASIDGVRIERPEDNAIMAKWAV